MSEQYRDQWNAAVGRIGDVRRLTSTIIAEQAQRIAALEAELAAVFRERDNSIVELGRSLAAAKSRIAELEGAVHQISDHLTRSHWRRDCDHIRHACEDIGCNGQHFRLIEDTIQQVLDAARSQGGRDA